MTNYVYPLPLDVIQEGEYGLTKHEYACISLKIPRTGIAEVDAVIREANRMEDARAAMQGMCANGDYGVSPDYQTSMAASAYSIADAMAQAREAGG